MVERNYKPLVLYPGFRSSDLRDIPVRWWVPTMILVI